jgi:GMP reductase
MVVDNDVKLDYSDVLLVPRESDINSRIEVELNTKLLDQENVVPIIAANMDGVGTFEMASQLSKYNILTALHKHYELQELVDFYTSTDNAEITPYTIYSMGTSKEDIEKFTSFNSEIEQAFRDGYGSIPNYVCIDVANGYTKKFEEFLQRFSEMYPQYVLIAGNVCTPERTERLIDCGVDIVKIGIGPGSVCTTRRMTGVGYPQFSAVLECAAAARADGGKIIADGGITCPGDAAKAFGAGASLIMLGGYLAGTDEGGGESHWSPGTGSFVTGERGGGSAPMLTHKKFYGMASKMAQTLHNGGVANYRASEGKEVLIPYRGSVKNIIQELLGGLRSACTYIGADSIDEMYHKAKFVKVNNQINNVFGS